MKVLVATDGSAFSEAAINKACELFGSQKETEIRAVSVFEPFQPIASEPFAVSAEYYHEMTESARKQAAHNAEMAETALRSGCSAAAVGSDVLEGKPSARIVEYAEEFGADIIVVGSHGRGFWGRLIGSVSNSVMHHAPCSVLVVRKEEE